MSIGLAGSRSGASWLLQVSSTVELTFLCYVLSAVVVIIIMYIYHVLINTLIAHMIHINLNMMLYTHVEHSPTKTIYIKYKNKK